MRYKNYVITITLYKLSSCLIKDNTFYVGTYLMIFENNNTIVQYFCIRLATPCQVYNKKG